MLNQKQTEELRELATPQIEQTDDGELFVTHRHRRIFFNWLPEYNQWFFIVHRTPEDATTGYPLLGWDCFTVRLSWVEGIAWGKQIIDQDLA